MTEECPLHRKPPRWLWWFPFLLLTCYVAVRMGAFDLQANVQMANGVIYLPNTFASVDHPFHVARAETLWRELASGSVLRWVGQHQGGYPVEFYPLGEAWLEVAIRTASIGRLTAEGAHTLAVIAIFLLPGAAFAALARQDGFSPAVALFALALHVSIPGGWYEGGYTELVQWGLVTNVAGAVAALLALPVMNLYVLNGDRRAAALAGVIGAVAIYCNPRSIVGLVALAGGAWVAAVISSRPFAIQTITLRTIQALALISLLTAPEIVALLRFGHLYEFVHYSGYETLADFARASAHAVGLFVLIVAALGIPIVVTRRRSSGAPSVVASLAIYVLLTIAIAFIPELTRLTAQLEPTRLMPLQRYLTIYLSAAAVWMGICWITSRFARIPGWAAPAAIGTLALAVVLVQTRPISGPAPDPASPASPPVSLYAVDTSGTLVQAELATAVRLADSRADAGTALLVLGSLLSWHQQLWAPLWTERPLYYDNWLWYWHPDHKGTPGYRPEAGHHFPDPERALERDYLSAHGIGAVVVAGMAKSSAAAATNLRLVQSGTFDVYRVVEPTATVTFGTSNAIGSSIGNQRIAATSEMPESDIDVRANWFPRWAGLAAGANVPLVRSRNGSIEGDLTEPSSEVELIYAVQNMDWAARMLAGVGIAWLTWLTIGPHIGRSVGTRWYAQRVKGSTPIVRLEEK